MEWVVGFDRIGHADLPRVGGKGANLGEMTAAGFPVPDGFCVTTDAFTAFLASAEGDVFAPLQGLAAADVDGARAAGAAVRDRLAHLPIPDDVREAVVAAWASHGRAHPYAVRSSATAEDLPDASFAGQQDTYLNVIGEDALLDAIRRCWISLYTDRAILYRIERGFPHDTVKLSVVVQRMVLPDVAGICFTADPISGRRDRICIDAGFGLGEALVSGLVSADLYTIDKASGTVCDKRIADKALRIRPLPEGGTVEEHLPPDQREAPALTDAQAEALARIALSIEAHYGSPQDIEWCLEGDRFAVVQSRPITTLFPLPDPMPDDGRLHVYICQGHVQGMTDPMPPMAHSILRAIYPFGKGDDPFYTPYLVEVAGRSYHDMSELMRLDVVRSIFPGLLHQSDPLMAKALAQVTEREEFRPTVRGEKQATWGGLAYRFARLGSGVLAQVFQSPEGLVARRAGAMERDLADSRARIEAAALGPDRFMAVTVELNALYEIIRERWFGPIFTGIFAGMGLRRLFGDDPDVDALFRAMPDNIVTRKDLDLAALALAILEDPSLSERVRTAPAQSVRALLEADPRIAPQLAAWLDVHGCRGPGEFDTTRDRYLEAFGPIASALQQLLAGDPAQLLAEHASLAAEADAAIERLVERSPTAQGFLVRRIARAARHLTSSREQPKYHGLQLVRIARESFAAEAHRRVEAGWLERVDDLWFLTLEELIEGVGDMRETVRERRDAHRRYAAMRAPRVFTSSGECVVAQHERGDAPEGALVGTSASPGVYEGRARVLLDPEQPLEVGDVLVTRATDPGWTPLFARAKALVMEVGGQMTHGSVIAREYGLPAVVCVPDATTVIPDGARIRVDGDLGWVQIL
ncbi:MAG: phosphoenolpyruvate synthase [Alphaproteobacteria bacterium]|nr:phosphoenolpyruvate synthase [Alphaproteobacteria bacterium]